MSYYTTSSSLSNPSTRSFGSMAPLTVEERADVVFETLLKRAETKGSLMKWFRQWDWDQKGFLDASKILRGVQQLHYNVDEEVAKALIPKFDLDGNNRIDYHEFCSVLRPTNAKGHRKNFFDLPQFSEEVPPEDLRPVQSGQFRGLAANEIAEKIFGELKQRAEASRSLFGWFRSWDSDKNGRLRREEIVNGLKGMQYHITDGVIEYLLHKFDVDGNGEINFHEFASVLQPKDGKDKHSVNHHTYSDLRPNKSMVDRVLARLWKRLPDNKDVLADLLETYDEDLTGLIRQNHFKAALLSLNIIRDFDIDIILKSQEFDAGGLVNYKAFLQDASRVGCFEETIDAGRSPRLHAPFKPDQLKSTLHDEQEIRRRQSQLNLSPRSTVATRYENKPVHNSESMAALLSPRDAPNIFMDESARFGRHSDYLPDQEQRAARRRDRLDAKSRRINEHERYMRERAEQDQLRQSGHETGRLAQMRKQQLWYKEHTKPVHQTQSWHG